MTVSLVISPLPGAGLGARAMAWLRGMQVKRLVRRLAGLDTVVLQGRVFALHARPLGICKQLVPALLSCSRRFTAWELTEALYDDLVRVLSLGLDTAPETIESLSIPPWELTEVIGQIARINGLPVLEAGRADLGELLTALTSTGTNTSPTSSAPAAGPGPTSTTN